MVRKELFELEQATMAQQALFAEKKFEEYRKHLKHIRIFLWVSLFVFAFLFFWTGEKGRYIDTKYYILDSKTGRIFNQVIEE